MTNKFAVVTGASTGIGRATAIELGRSGVTVALVARNKEKLEETKRLVEEVGGKAVVFQADLSNIDLIIELIESIKQQTEKVDILINIAGIWHDETQVFAGLDFENFRQQTILDTFSVGLIAPTLLVHGLVSIMPQESSIINLSGTFENGARGWLPYYVSKRGIEDLTKGLAEELKDKQINVNCVSPADTLTEAYKKNFPEDVNDSMNVPEDVAREILSVINANRTGQFVLIRNKQTSDGYHK